MPKSPVFLGYSRTALDSEYNNSGKVADAASIIHWYSSRSTEYTAQSQKMLGLQYGSGYSQALDLYFPDGEIGRPDQARPVHVFFHGGYWQAMHKQDFSFVANAFSDTDTIVAIIDYDLIPEVDMNQLVNQCRASLVWLYQNIAMWGGNPDNLTLSGHSAGGHLVGMMMATDWQQQNGQLPRTLVKAGVSLSGLFDLEPLRHCYLNDTLGLTEQDVEDHSPLLLSNENAANLICLYGEFEGDEYARQSQSLATAWKKTTALPITGHNHFSIARELDDPGSVVSGYLRTQVKDLK